MYVIFVNALTFFEWIDYHSKVFTDKISTQYNQIRILYE